jgi:hypothetical protein
MVEADINLGRDRHAKVDRRFRLCGSRASCRLPSPADLAVGQPMPQDEPSSRRAHGGGHLVPTQSLTPLQRRSKQLG